MGPNCLSTTAKLTEEFISEHGLDGQLAQNIQQFGRCKTLNKVKVNNWLEKKIQLLAILLVYIS